MFRLEGFSANNNDWPQLFPKSMNSPLREGAKGK